MLITRQPAALNKMLNLSEEFSKNLAFVPTMGALHAGHLRLVEAARAGAPKTVASIFVNPTQFNDPVDFQKYPRTLAGDLAMLEEAGLTLAFVPETRDVYPDGLRDLESYPLGFLETILEGRHRPGHFQGVCQVVSRLLLWVKPGLLFMGQKDYQQCLVIKTLIGHLGIPVQLIMVPTEREPSGLAMSSRNRRLSEEHLQKAAAIYDTIARFIPARLSADMPQNLRKQAAERLLQAGFDEVEYVEIAHPETLQPIESYDPHQPTVVLTAAWIGGVRLIDNWIIPANYEPASPS